MGVFVPSRGPHRFQTRAIGSEYSMYVGWRERRGGGKKKGERREEGKTLSTEKDAT